MSKEIKFKFLKDAPLSNTEEGVFEFYHEKIAPALREILESESCVHTIGLFSRWGTGKSTVIEMIRKDLKYPIFVFDAWKYQDDALRRIFLIKLVEFLNQKGEQIDSSILDSMHKTIEMSEQIKITDQITKNINWRQKILLLLKKHWLLLVTLVLIVVWVVLNLVFDNKNILIQSVRNFAAVVASFSLLGYFLAPLFTKIWERHVNKFIESLSPLSTIKTRVEIEERFNSPEQFEMLFQKIIEKVNKKIIIVFDNIDRVQGDTAIKILSTIKTFLDPKLDSKCTTGLTFIVPCDSDAIINQITTFYGSQINQEDIFDPSEYLRKLFNVIIWMPEFIEADLHEYIKCVIQDTGEIKDLLGKEDVAFVIGSAFSNNPREIKQFINNLISALVLASKTEVWERIKSNIPYLAKILVLKQKYPTAYRRLKDKWFEPESILQDNDESELRNFMLNTSRITVDNAEPFIYFKEPTISKNLINSEGLTIALVEGDKEKATEIVRKEKDKNAVVDFVKLLLRKYRNQKELLLNIFTIHIEVFNRLKISTSKKVYYETLARVLDTDLWQYFAKLPTNFIFSNLLTKKELDRQFCKPLIQRYVLSLGNEEVRKPDKLGLVKDILVNLKKNITLVESGDRIQIAKFIDEHFSTNPEIISLFENLKEQEDFITPQAFDKFITNINSQTFSNEVKLIFQFKEFIVKKKKFSSVLQKITELIQKETSEHPDHRPQKDVFMKACGDIFSEFQKELSGINGEIKTQLIKQLIQAFNGISAWDNRASLVNNFHWLSSYVEDPQKTEIDNLINSFFQHASATKVSEVLDYWDKKSAEGLINDHFQVLSPRSMQDDDFLDVVYKKADKDSKIKLITNLINQKGANSLSFIKKLGDNLPDRQTIVKLLLDKIPSIPLGEQVLIYDYLPDQVNKNDTTELKDRIVEQIKALLKSDTPASQEAGLNLISKAEFLSEEKKREIGKEVLDWLRQPGKVLNINHRFVLKAVSGLVKIMQETPVKDFVYTLFDMLRQDRDKQSLEVSFEIIDEIKPKYSNYEKDFKDFLDRLKEWPQNENKALLVERIKNLKSKNPSKTEKAYWKEINSLIKEEE